LICCRCTEDEMDKYGIHLLALSHVYNVPQLKQKCIKGLVQRLTIENVVDVLQLARLCDAPDLRLRCMKLLTNHFNAVQKSEGWKFLTKHDPWLELDILHFMDESETVCLINICSLLFSSCRFDSCNNIYLLYYRGERN
jgi:hypothetical protein